MTFESKQTSEPTCFLSFLANLSKFFTCISARAAGSAGSTSVCCCMRVFRTFFVRALALAIASSGIMTESSDRSAEIGA